jgi:hypothetical protein
MFADYRPKFIGRNWRKFLCDRNRKVDTGFHGTEWTELAIILWSPILFAISGAAKGPGTEYQIVPLVELQQVIGRGGIMQLSFWHGLVILRQPEAK